ncbi:hypothetical protein HMPREF0975_01327 [Actinomyces sp. oral taxon 849 str. F0330]|mgnify:CR=1 FL=1|nr:hypothetical protein HMPREF0975_01327 [Actinomyces sp. oral taxon 849 str. F0330]
MLVTGLPSRAGSEIVVWPWEKLLSIRRVTRRGSAGRRRSMVACGARK